ncbi:MAG: molybdate ABC transporter substrate-binding protein [Planctomycetota bacterium]|nr:molybdate ABC transporter substrate-binding protein [Planctomycetota bacterium]
MINRLVSGLALVAFALTAMLPVSCRKAETSKRTLQVFCGAASKPAMEECATAFEKKTGIKVEVEYGGSGTLLSKMKMSGRGDVYIPGSPDYMVKAQRDGITDPAGVKIAAYLVPAILVQKGNPKGIRTLEDLARPGMRVGIGNPEAVCVGLYAVEILAGAGLLDSVKTNIAVHAESCEKTAALVVLRQVDAVIGWDVFASWSPDSTAAVMIDPAKVPRIAYVPAAVCRTSKDPAAAREFVDFLSSVEAHGVFSRLGYITEEQEARKLAPNAGVSGEYTLPADYNRP